MALKENFYEEIYENERTWIELIDSNLINVYYLPELKKFYSERYLRMNYEYELTGNPIIQSMSVLMSNIISKIDYIVNEYRLDHYVEIKDLKNYFLVNHLNNNISYDYNREKIEDKPIYRLRSIKRIEEVEDYMDDDFYYKAK